MKKYISYLLTLALLVPTLVSCTEQLEEIRAKKNTHTVYFSTSSQTTKTGLTIDGNMVNPDWRQTDVENVHFFEMETAGGDAAYAVATEINPSSEDNNITAHFKASFGKEIDIIVNPPANPLASTKAGDGSGTGYYYGAVVAQKNSDNEDDYTFKIPAEQKPDDQTLKDPDADFLVGFSRNAYAAHNDEENVVDLYFDRVAALGRFAFTNFKGTDEKVMSVKIESEAGLVGSASYSNITWGDENTVSFERVEGPLTLSYGENGVDVPTGKDAEPFYAYFVVIPGEAKITSIEVVTDQYRYTKTPTEPVPFTFSAKEFMPIAMDLSRATAEEISSNVWYKASVLEAGYDYLIVSGGQALKNNEGATAAVAVTPEDDIISFESATDPTIIWRATAHTENTGDNGQGGIIAGHFTLTNDGMYLLRDSQEITLGDAIPSAKPKYAVWDYDGTYLKQESSDTQTQYCYYNNGWATGYTQNGAAPASSIKTVEIFTTRPPQSINFEKSDYDWILEDGDFTAPELLGDPVGAVSYASSDASIAEVNAETGAVTIKKAGNVVISVTAAGSTEYQTTVASYTIHITSNNIPTWYKVDEIVNGETYMIISNGYALKLNSSNGLDALANEAFTGADSFQYEKVEALMWTAGASSGKFTLKSGSRYLSRSSSAPATSSGTSYAWSYDSANNNLSIVNNSTTYHLYVSGNGNKWALSTDGTGTHTVAVYSQKRPLAPRNLSFGNDPVTVTHDLATQGTDVAEPTLMGASEAALVGVTYAKTSDPKGVISTIDAATGAITLVSGKTGTAVITASAAANETYKAESVSYALIVKEGSAPLKYVKISSTSDLTVGAQYLLVYEGGGTGDNAAPKVFRPTLASDGNTFNKSGDDALAVDITSDKTITSNDFVFGHLTLETGYYLQVDAVGKYLYASSSSSGSGTLSAEATPSHNLTIDFDNGIVKIQAGTGSNYLVWSTSSSYFSSNASLSGQYSTGICLYKLDEGGSSGDTPQDQNLSFPEDSYTAQVGTTFEAPELSGAKTTVTYASSNTSVATVNAATGAVTLVAAGETTITASAPAGTVDDISYKAGSAQYTLTVSPASASSTYVLISGVSELVSGASYLLVSADANNYNGADHKKVFTGETSGAAEDVTPDGNTITGNYSDYEFTISVKSASNNTYVLNGKNGYMTRGTSDPYISFSSSEATLTLNPDKTTAANQAFFFYVMNNSNQDTFYYNKNGNFKIGNTGGTYGCHLYMRYNGEELAQNLSFSKTEVTYNMYGSPAFTAPTLSGAKTSVTYSSSNTGVARVNTSTGEIEFVGAGETNITATAGSGTINGINYASGSASYKLTVENEEVTVPYYTKVNDVSGLPDTRGSLEGNYIFVFEDGNKAYVFKAICNGTPSSSTYIELTKDGSAIEVDLTANGIAATEDVQACKMQLSKHDSKEAWNIKAVTADCWIRINASSSSSARIQAMPGSGYSSTFTFSGEGNNLTLSRKESNSSNTAYLRFNTTQTYFDATTSSTAVSLYKLEENP